MFRNRRIAPRELASSSVALALVGVALCCLVTACDAQADAGYSGEPLFSLTGEVDAVADPARYGDLHVALAWMPNLYDPQGFTDANFFYPEPGVRLAGNPQAFFSLDVHEIPTQQNAGCTGVRVDGSYHEVCLAAIIVYDADDEETREDPCWREDGRHCRFLPAGVSLERVLVYAPADIPADPDSELTAGGELAAGFHLMKLVPGAPWDEVLGCWESCFTEHCGSEDMTFSCDEGTCRQHCSSPTRATCEDEQCPEPYARLVPLGADDAEKVVVHLPDDPNDLNFAGSTAQ